VSNEELLDVPASGANRYSQWGVGIRPAVAHDLEEDRGTCAKVLFFCSRCVGVNRTILTIGAEVEKLGPPGVTIATMLLWPDLWASTEQAVITFPEARSTRLGERVELDSVDWEVSIDNPPTRRRRMIKAVIVAKGASTAPKILDPYD